MQKMMLVCVLILCPSMALAAYQNPTVISNDRQRDGSTRLVFQFTGSAGEPTVRRDFIVSAGTTATGLRNWIDDTIKELDLLNTAGTLSILQPGQTVPRLARPTPPPSVSVPTAKDVWLDKFWRYLQLKDAGIAAMAPAMAAMKADLEATYQAGFLDR